MNSFQQIFVAVSCLGGAFFFGRYMHSRPTLQIQQPALQAPDIDPIESFLGASNSATPQPIAKVAQHTFAPIDGVTVPTVQPVVQPILQTSETTIQPVVQQSAPPLQRSLPPIVDSANTNPKPTAPDFSELKARFGNTALEMPNPNPPQMVLRQPEKSWTAEQYQQQLHQQQLPQQQLSSSFKPASPLPVAPRAPEPEEYYRPARPANADTFSSVQNRWKVSRPGQIDEFNSNRPESIDDIYNDRSADYLRGDSELNRRFQPESQAAAWGQPSATMPIEQDLASDQNASSGSGFSPRNDFRPDNFRPRNDFRPEDRPQEDLGPEEDYGSQFIPQHLRRQHAPEQDVATERSVLTEENSRTDNFAPQRFQAPPAAQPQFSSRPSFEEIRRGLDADDPGIRFSRPRPPRQPAADAAQAWGSPQGSGQRGPSAFQPRQPQRQQVQQEQFQQRRVPANVVSNNQRTYRIQPGDTLQNISTRFYGTADHYIEIYRANRDRLDSIMNAPGGVEIIIPTLQ